MSQAQPYSAKTVYWLLAVGVLSFAGAAYFMVYSESDVGAAKANAFSYSAIGHKAVVETLREVEIPVLVSRVGSAAKAGDSSLLVVAEPRLENWYEETLDAAPFAATILLVLPKWDGFKDEARPHWLRLAGMVPRKYVESVLRSVDRGGAVLRVAGPLDWTTGSLGAEPTIAYPQLLDSDALEPVIWSDQGILLGVLVHDGQTIWILSDPDILSNHGLGQGDNAVLTLRLFDMLRPAGGAVIFDEAVHGYWQPPNLWRALLELPFVVPVFLALATVLIVAWAATARFGSPLPARPPFISGKTTLIENTASLLRFGGFGSAILKRYADATLRDVADRLNAPRKLEGAALIAWVDRVGTRRGAQRKFKDLYDRASERGGHARRDGPRLARLARRLYQWKREVIDGS